MSDKGKAVGGAALGGAGIVAALLKGGAAEVGVAKTGLKVAAGAGVAEHGLVTGAKGIGALEGAGAAKGLGAGVGALEGAGAAKGLGALEHAGATGGSKLATGGFAVVAEHGAPTFERATLFSHADFELTTIAAHGAEPATKGGAVKVVTGAGDKVATSATMTKSARTAKVHDVLEHAVDAKDLVEKLGDVWDFAQGGIDDDEEKRVASRLEAKGLDFRGDVVPAFQGLPAAGLPLARRELLTDGHGLVPAFRLDTMPAGARLVPYAERREVGRKVFARDPGVVVYATSLELAGIPNATSGVFLVTELTRSTMLSWHELPSDSTNEMHAPRVITIEGRRYASILPVHAIPGNTPKLYVVSVQL